MSELINAKKGAPSFVLYIISFSTTFMLTSALTMLFDSTSAGSVRASQLIMGGTVLIGNFIASSFELLLLRKKFGKITFFVSFVIELAKFADTIQFVTAIDNQLLVALSSASLFSLLISKIFNEKITRFSASSLSKNMTQILPTIGILLLFTGGSILSSLGLAPISQSANPQPFDVSNVDFSKFKVPSWNSQYYLDNVLDQFRAGLDKPFEVVFNVTNNSPDAFKTSQKISAYFKEKTYYDYEYDSVKALAGTFFPLGPGLSTDQSLVDGIPNNQILSKEVPSSLQSDLTIPLNQREYSSYSLTISKAINHTSLYQSDLPVVWNSRTYGYNGGDNSFYGSFINTSTVSVYGSDGIILENDCSPKQSITSCSYYETQDPIQNFKGMSAVGLQLNGFPSDSENSILKYGMNYLEPNYNQISAFSRNRNYYSTVFDVNTWNAIKTYYLQIPNSNDNTLPSGFSDYNSWAPTAYQIAQTYNNSGISVMAQILSLVNAMRPGVDFTNPQNNQHVTYPGGTLGLTFDMEFWITQTRLQDVEGETYPYQDAREDYVNWFLGTVKKGVSSEFASALTMLLRLQGIPARFVTGYAFGNSTYSSNPFENVYQRLYSHAWTEALVPLETPAGPSFEWVVVDPIGYLFGGALSGFGNQNSNTQQQYILLDPFHYNSTIVFDINNPASVANVQESINRVGVDENFNSILDAGDDGIFLSNGPITVSTTNGSAMIAVYVAIGTITDGVMTALQGAGSVNITFQLVGYDENNNSFVKNWNNTNGINKVIAVSNPTTNIASVEFNYQPLFSNFTSLHGQGLMNFIAIISNNLTAENPSCLQLSCVNAFSDSNRIDLNQKTPHTFEISNSPLNHFKVNQELDSIKQPNQVFIISYPKIEVIQTRSHYSLIDSVSELLIVYFGFILISIRRKFLVIIN